MHIWQPPPGPALPLPCLSTAWPGLRTNCLCTAAVLQDEEVVLVSSTIDLRDMPVEEAYKGPRMAGAWGPTLSESPLNPSRKVFSHSHSSFARARLSSWLLSMGGLGPYTAFLSARARPVPNPALLNAAHHLDPTPCHAPARLSHAFHHVTSWLAGSNEEGYTITPEFVQGMIAEFKEQRTIHRWVV